MKNTRFPALVVVLTVSLASICGWTSAKDTQEFASTKPVPRNVPGWMARHKSMNDRVKKGNVDLLMIGDSITQGWESRGKDVWKKFYEKRNAVNLGISGDQTQHAGRVPGHGNHVVASLVQGHAQPPADEAGCARATSTFTGPPSLPWSGLPSAARPIVP